MYVGRGSHWKGISTGWPSSWPQGTGDFPHSSALGMYGLTPILTVEAVWRPQPWEREVLLRASELCMWLNPIKASLSTFKILTVGVEIYVTWLGGQAWYVPRLLNPSLPIWSSFPLSSGSSCPVRVGLVYKPTCVLISNFQFYNLFLFSVLL